MSALPGQQITVPARLTDTVRAEEGGAGRARLAALPALVADHLDRWGLTLERIGDPGGRSSLVGYVHRDDDLSPAVLKAALSAPGAALEAEALRHWSGRGAVLLIDAAPAAGVLLLERLHGDIPLRSLPDARAMTEATSLLRRLWVPPAGGHPFPLVGDHAAGLADLLRERRTLPGAEDAAALVDEALETSAALAASQPEQLLLHGDFHHGKVLAADRSPWLAVAPEPLVGERAFDLARLVRDRMDTLAGSPGPRAAVRRRLHSLAEALEVDRDRLRGWTLLRTVAAGLRSLSRGDREHAELYLEFAAWL